MIFHAVVGVNLCNSTLSRVYVLTVRTVGQLQGQLAHDGLLLVVLFKDRGGQLWTDTVTLNESFDSPDGKDLFRASLLALIYQRLLQFPHLCRINLLGRIFLRGIKHWLLVLFLAMFILYIILPMFMLTMYWQNDQKDILEVLENEILFAARSWSEELYRIL